MNKKHMILTAILVVLILIIKIPAEAADTPEHKLNGGVGNYGRNRRYYYIDSSCSSDVAAKINAAWSDWIYTTTTTPISTRQTTTKSQSVFDFYIDYTDTYGTLDAYTEFYVNPKRQIIPSIKVGEGMGNAEDWDWTNIQLHYERFFDLNVRYPGRSFDLQKALIAHEIGHAMGLVHMSETSLSIMRMGTENLYDDKCTTQDLQAINALYGGNE